MNPVEECNVVKNDRVSKKKKIRNFQYLRFLWEEHDNIVLETCLIHIIE
jgi:hypothetical protein